MKKCIYILFLFTVLSCKTHKGNMIASGGINEIITNAILDFSSTSRIYHQERVFAILAQDTFKRRILEKPEDYSIFRWKSYNDIATVGISPVNKGNKILLTSKTKVGSKGGGFPSRFVEFDNKLFYWWDDDYPLTQALFDIFAKYDLLQDDEGGTIQFPDYTIDDSKRGVDYFFCKNNLLIYKKITTNRGMGYYDMPELECK